VKKVAKKSEKSKKAKKNLKQQPSKTKTTSKKTSAQNLSAAKKKRSSSRSTKQLSKKSSALQNPKSKKRRQGSIVKPAVDMRAVPQTTPDTKPLEDQKILAEQQRQEEAEFLRKQKLLEAQERLKEREFFHEETSEDRIHSEKMLPCRSEEKPEGLLLHSPKKGRILLWLIIFLFLLIGLTGYLFIFQPYLKSKQSHQKISSIDFIIEQTRVLLQISSAAHIQASSAPTQKPLSGPISLRQKDVTSDSIALQDNFMFRSYAVYQIQLGDIQITFNLQKLVPFKQTQPTPQPTIISEKPQSVPDVKKSSIKILKIKANPRSVPLSGKTKLTAFISEKDKSNIAKIIWKSKSGTILSQNGLTAVWQAPDKKGTFRVTIIILAKDGTKTIKHITLYTSQNIYIADVQNHCIQKFSGQGKFLFKFGEEGNAPGQFESPNSVAVDHQGNVWVADTGNNRIQKFSSSGEFILMFGQEGEREGEFKEPYVIAIDPDDNIFVAEFVGNRIQKFDSEGQFILQFGTAGSAPGEFNNPSGIYIDANTSYFYVSDMKNHRVQKFNLEGDFIMQFGSKGSNKGQFNSPVGIAIDSKSNIYVVDQVNHRIQKFSPKGKYLLWFGGEGQEPGRLYYPMGIVINRADEIFITDQCNHRVSIYDPEGNYYGSFGERGSGNGKFLFPIGISLDF